MSTITKEWLQQKIADMEAARDEIPFGLDEDDSNTLAALHIALASLEAEAVGEVVLGEFDDCGCHPDAKVVCIAADGQADWENFKDGTRLYTAPPAPVSVPTFDEWLEIRGNKPLGWVKDAMRESYDACRAAMLQGAEPVTTDCKLPANVIDALEKALQAMLFMGDTLNAMDAVCKEDVEYVTPAFEAVMAVLDGSSPVTPGDWVACSERMPEQFVEALVCTEDGGRYVAALNQSMAWDDGDFFDDIQYVTHWMPLPAAPKQEV